MIEVHGTATADELEDTAAALGELVETIATGECDVPPLCGRLLLSLLDEVEALLAARTAIPTAA